MFLMGHDSDRFNRWEAGQTIGTRLIVDAMTKLKARRSIAAPERLRRCARRHAWPIGGSTRSSWR